MILWTLWFGKDPIEKSMEHGPRHVNRDRLDKADIPHLHLTIKDLHLVNCSSNPIHREIFLDRLSGIHKADYMRSYLMYNFGGAYTDIKSHLQLDWIKFFKDFQPDAWVYGGREYGPGGVGCATDVLSHLGIETNCTTLRKDYFSLVHNGAYIFRRHSPFAREWLDRNNKQLDDLEHALGLHPSPISGRCCQNGEGGYPIRWAQLHGELFHPLCWKYSNHVQTSKIGFIRF